MVNLMNFEKRERTSCHSRIRDLYLASDILSFPLPCSCFLLGRIVTLDLLQTTMCGFLTLKADWYKVLVRFWSTKTWRKRLAKATVFLPCQTRVSKRSLLLLLLARPISNSSLYFLSFSFFLSKLSIFSSLSLSHSFSLKFFQGKAKNGSLRVKKNFYT